MRAATCLTGVLLLGGAIGGAAPARPDLHAGLAVQVALDRSGISPGLLDGRPGPVTRHAVALFQRSRGLPSTGKLDAATAGALGLAGRAPTVSYTVTAEDLAGPFEPIPADLMAQGALPALGYASAEERVAERFHTDPETLARLNPGQRLAVGTTLQVPDVAPLVAPAETARRSGAGTQAARVGQITVSVTPPLLVVTGHRAELLFAAPATTGSEHDPLPLGTWKVLDVYLKPIFHYNPALFWDADPSHARTIIQPGPNNPVGLAWIDIDRKHYGLHGTPVPGTIGQTTSHGCVRLTNWDVVRLLDFVALGTRVVFDEHLPAITPSAP